MTNLKNILFAVVLCAMPAAYSHAQTEDGEIGLSMETDGDEEEQVDFTDDYKAGIDMPESMEHDIDSLLKLYSSHTYLKIDPDCNMPATNPSYTDEEYIARLKRLPTIMEMPYNGVVRQFIDKYAGYKQMVGYMLGAQNFYMPIFEQALEERKLPLELKYLPVIESALNPNAVSRVGATGLWQFMVATGKQYGLEINSLVDERRDPVKSSHAAAAYLSDLFKIFGDWNLVIAAYNCGPENVRKAITRAGGEKDYWDIYPWLPKETRGYVPAFIAANYIMNYYCDHNICPLLTDLPAKTDTVVVDRDMHIEQIAAVLQAPLEQLKALNPQYRQGVVNGFAKPSAVRLPMDYVSAFIENEDTICAYNAEALLAKRDIVDVREQKPVQGVGKTVSKKSKASRKYVAAKNKRSKRTKAKSVSVRKGDTLSEIAARNGTTVSKLKKLNGIKGSNIRAGKKIRVR